MADAYDEPFKKETEEACARLAECEKQKQEFDLDIRESYYFSAPHRAREIRSAQALSTSKPDDAGKLQTGIAMELADDFVTVIINSFMPPAEPWAEQKPGMFLPAEVRTQAKKIADEQDPVIFEAIRASNLYEELPKAASPDLAIGTMALWIDDPRPAENIVVQAVPLHELEINIGPFGEIDDRFVVRHTKNRHVKALLGSVYDKLDAECRRDIEDPKKQDENTVIRWGYWRLWERRDDVVWQHVVMKDKKVVYTATLVGAGSCPLIPFRFAPSPEWAFGNGPLIKSLPELRTLDEIEGKKIEHIDMSIKPPMGYPDDSMAAIEGGVESGTWYPVRPGSQDAIKRLVDPGTMEPAIYEVSEKERMLRHRFYLDWPEQRGDTPPTATQWLDEMQIAQRRIGTPGMSFWKEGPAHIFLRFKYLLVKAGRIQEVKVDGKTISLQPYNPAQRAAEQQEVAMFARFAQLGAPLFPEEWKLVTNGAKTLDMLAEKMRVKKIWVARSEDEQKAAVQQIAQLMGGQPGEAPAVG